MSEPDCMVEALKRSRGSAAELKLKLVTLRSELPKAKIFVFEGDEDRGVYYGWVRFVDATFRFEPFTCKGKSGVLKLKEAVDRDTGNLRQDVYFFIDRDYDESRGVVLDDSIYMTDQYSIENYLVNSSVVEEILKIEFHCHAEPAVRARVLAEFERLYDSFLQVSSDVNRELYAARRLGVALEEDLGASISRFATVSLDAVERLPVTSSEVVKPVRTITPDEFEQLEAEFTALEPRARYRGKYALSFLLRWLDVLARDRKSEASMMFRGLDLEVKVRCAHLTAITLGSRSVPPASFIDFFSKIPAAA